jgi:GrpB-like predicted nucleotidyltransferase (UPF0157 family)
VHDAAPQTPLTEEEIRASMVGELTQHAATIHLAVYDPTWPLLFRREDARIRRTLGDRVLRLEHVGSTSVPGLSAKPIVDMTLVVADSSDENAYVPDLEGAGYFLRIREPDWYEHRILKGPDTNVNLHVFSDGCTEVERMVAFRDWLPVAFRDWLRTHDDDRELYESAKRDLAAREWKYVQNYADAKSEIVRRILARALAAGGDDEVAGVSAERA